MDIELGADEQSNCGAEPCVCLQNLRRLLLYDKGGLDEGVEEDVEAVRQLRQDVHARLLAGDVQALVDHLQLPDLLSIQPNNLSKVFTPDHMNEIICFLATNNVSVLNVTDSVLELMNLQQRSAT